MDNGSACPTVPPNIGANTGPLLLGNLFNYGLLGMLSTQVLVYHTSFPKDRIGIKGLVWGVFFIEILNTIFLTIGAYKTLGPGWGDLAVLIPVDWSYPPVLLLSGLISSSVHAFFCWRIWKLRQIYIIPGFIMIVSLLQWSMASFVGIQSRKLGILNVGSLTPYVIVWLVGASVCDILIAVTMVTILFQAGGRSAFQRTKSLTMKLITLTVNTGMITALWAIGDLIVFVSLQHSNWHTIPFLMLSKLYSNTLLATLNSRTALQHTVANSVVLDIPLWNELNTSSGPTDTTLRSFTAVPGSVSSKGIPQFRVSTTGTQESKDYELNSMTRTKRAI